MSNPGKRALAVVSPSCSAILFAALPKCPACLLFLLAPLGIPFPAARPLLTFVAMALLAVPLLFLSTPSCRRCRRRPLYLAIAGSAVMTIGRFAASGSVLPIAGALMILAAVLWGRFASPAYR